ncbi:MAG: FAD-binding oxidoreductase, partial [Usitatibacteraceae bacterium]
YMADEGPDVIVVGAGIIGLACAFRLAREGQRVLLLDRDQPGLGASFGNAGHIATEQVFPLASPAVVRGALRYLLDPQSPLRIRPAYMFSILPWLIRFAKASHTNTFDRGVMALSALQKTAHTDIAQLLGDAGASHLLKMHGHLVLVENAKSTNAARKEITQARAFGIDTDWISPAQVKQIAPDITTPIEGAVKFEGTGHVDDPYAVCMALRDAFLAAGGRFVQNEVTKVDSAKEGFAVQTASSIYRAKHLVLSCGAWSKALASQLGYMVPLDTERGYHITLPGVQPQFNIPIASFERKVIMTPMSSGLRMTGTVEFGGLVLPADPGRFAMLTRHMNALVANIPTDSATTWMGFRPSLPDHLPVLGRAPDGRNLFFAFGHQHLGLTLAGVTARIIAAQVIGRDPEINLAPYSPNRF